MYKVIIQTRNISHLTKSPTHNTIDLTSKGEYSQPLIKNSNSIIYQKFKGKIHLLRNLSTGIKQLVAKLKSRAVLIINGNKQIEKYVQERKSQIENLDYVDQEVINDENLVLGVKYFMIVVFKSLALAEELFSICNYSNHLNCLALHIQSVTIVCTNNPIDSSLWKKFLQEKEEEPGGKELWVELPSCLKCLQMLEAEVTGMNLREIRNDKEVGGIVVNPVCKICWVRLQQQTKCTQCKGIVDNWLCMICGIIGCGRYKNGDAFKHYLNSSHILSLDLKTNYIWNYKFDCFSHRVAGRQDSSIEIIDNQLNLQIYDDDIEIQFWKYCNVVEEQLEKQKNFYMKVRVEEISRFQVEEGELGRRVEELQKEKEEKKQLIKKKVKKNKKMSKKLVELQKQCLEQRLMNESLQQSSKVKNQSMLKSLMESKKEELKKLEEDIQGIYLKLSGS